MAYRKPFSSVVPSFTTSVQSLLHLKPLIGLISDKSLLMECFPMSSVKGLRSQGGNRWMPLAEPHSNSIGRYFSFSNTCKLMLSSLLQLTLVPSNTTKG